ncbi:DNA polymerase kappa [Orchesella cincta]|uniref:DNA polymerase kappa n=1 Tax=Orchesella cincta TaxID=48709 RepID=A0A1D2MQC4_ORCCI|nr:DNA polymerase kappa [Orchesella cincta]
MEWSKMENEGLVEALEFPTVANNQYNTLRYDYCDESVEYVCGDDVVIEDGEEKWTYDDCQRVHLLQMHSEEQLNRAKSYNPGLVGNGVTAHASGHVPLMALNTTKAGMEGLDVETINRKIQEASQGSKFHEHKKKEQLKIDRKISDLTFQLEKLTPLLIEQALEQVDKLVASIEAKSDLGSRHYVHIDMDAFYAAVEMRDDLSLRSVPMAVGSDSMLSTSNYLARRSGVRAGMPGFIGKKLCPQLKIVPCDFEKYTEASKWVQSIIRKYDPNADMYMDEGSLDITDYLLKNHMDQLQDGKMCPATVYSVVDAIRMEILEVTKLTASAGIGPTRFLAKLCSNVKKPNGQCQVYSTKEAIMELLRATPIRNVNGIGPVMEQELNALTIYTCRDLWTKRAILSLLFKRATFQFLLGIAMGTGSSVFRECGAEPGDRKSLSCERTFIGTSDLNFLENVCRGLCIEIEKDLKSNTLSCKTITLKIKTTDFEVKTRARSIMERTDSAEKIFESAWKIYLTYASEISDLTIRLMGVRVSNFEPMTTTNAQYKIQQFLQNRSEEKKNYRNVVHNYKIGAPCFNVSCPICQKMFSGSTEKEVEKEVDRHIDECLSRSKLKQLRGEFLASATAPPTPSLPKKRSATSTVVSSNAKQAKRSSDVTIDHFFKKL